MLRAPQYTCPRLGRDGYYIAAPGHMLLFVNHLKPLTDDALSLALPPCKRPACGET